MWVRMSLLVAHFRWRSQNYEKRLVASSCLFVCMNKSAPIGRIFMKFYIRNSAEKIRVLLKYDKTNRYST
jgi:hypothetical protein